MIVTPQDLTFDEPLTLTRGGQLERYTLRIETYGQLNASADNAVLICHALSGDHHAAGRHHPEDKKPGWWDHYIGPGKPIDTNKFFVVSLNNLGGCSGSTGPVSIDPNTGRQWGPEFPAVTVQDWVESQARLADRLGIQTWAAVIGGSLGGMQALQWSIQYPDRLRHCCVIAAAPKLSTQNIAFNEIARQAITRDPEFHEGRYAEHDTLPKSGLSLARMVGHVTYLSDQGLGDKFGRNKQAETQDTFQIESYLRYQGEAFTTRFDANTYVLMTKALDWFDPAGNGKLADVLSRATCSFQVISFSSDWRFSPERSVEIVNALIQSNHQVSYTCVETDHGHDGFLLPNNHYEQAFAAYLNRIEVSA